MDEWLRLLASGVLGAIAGALSSLFVASRLARGSELGRTQEEARQRLASAVKVYRAQVEVDRADAGWRNAMRKDYLSNAAGLAFAEAIERDLVHVPHRLEERIHDHLKRLIGPVDAHTARLGAQIPLDERGDQWRVQMYLNSVGVVGEDVVADNGVLGRARDAQRIGEHLDAVVAELRAMDATIQKARIGLFRR